MRPAISSINFVLVVVVVATSAQRASAQQHAACCFCGDWYVLSEEGFGFARHHVDLCPDCKAKFGSVDAELEKLRGKLRGLREAADLTLQRLREAIAKRDAARDSIYGRNGQATKFFKSLMSFAAQGAGGAFKKIASGISKGLKWYDRGMRTAEGDVAWALDEGQDWAKDQAVDKAALKIAAENARRYYEQTKDARGATDRLLSGNAGLKKGLKFFEGAQGFYDATDGLANAIQEYLEARADAQRLEKEWNEIVDQMEPILADIAKLEHCRQAANAQGRAGAAGERPVHLLVMQAADAGDDLTIVALNAQRAEVKAMMDESNQPLESDLTLMREPLDKLKADLGSLQGHVENEVAPLLLPFWHDLQDDMGPELSRALLELAGPAVDSADDQFEQIMTIANDMCWRLRHSMADATIANAKDDGADRLASEGDYVKVATVSDGVDAVRMLTVSDVDAEAGHVTVSAIGAAGADQPQPMNVQPGRPGRIDLDGDGAADAEIAIEAIDAASNTALLHVKPIPAADP